MKISIITPYYRGKNYISQLLQSVKRQGAVGHEHVIVNDGCREDQKFLEGLQGEYDFRIVLQDNLGLPGAVNRGVAETDGDVISWINHDDMFCEGALQSVMETFREHPEADIVHGQCYLINAETEILKLMLSEEFSYERLLRYGNYLPQPSIFVKRGALRGGAFLDARYKLAVDYELWLRLGRYAAFRYLPRPLACFRIHRGSLGCNNQMRFIPEKLRIVREYGGSYLSPVVIRMGLFAAKEPARMILRGLGLGEFLRFRSFFSLDELRELKRNGRKLI